MRTSNLFNAWADLEFYDEAHVAVRAFFYQADRCSPIKRIDVRPAIYIAVIKDVTQIIVNVGFALVIMQRKNEQRNDN